MFPSWCASVPVNSTTIDRAIQLALDMKEMRMASSVARATYTDAIVDYAARFSYDDLPAGVVDWTKTIVMDTLGALLLGSNPQYRASWLTGDLAKSMGGKPECTVIGRDFKTSVESATLANGTMGYAADIEGAGVARQHVPAVLVPVALAMGERQASNGQTLIAALALGYEISCRVSEACRTPHSYPHSFHPSALFGYIGSAMTAGHILKLDAQQMRNALGLSASNATGLMTWVTDPTEHSRPFVIGMAARGGVTCALLAELGFGGPPAVLDAGKYSIYDAYAGEMHLDRLIANLGEGYWIDTARGFKRHPCCGDTHTGIDALLKLMAGHGLTADDIETIVHRVKADRAPVIDNNPLKSHCAQYVLSVAAVRGEIVSDDILVDRRETDPVVADIYRRTTLIGDPELDRSHAHAPAIVEVTTRDGRRFVEAVDWSKGSQGDPMTQDELEAKFLRLATTRISRDRAEQALRLVQRLPEVDDVGELAALLQAET